MCKDTDIFRIFASYFIIDIIMSIDNTLKARVQHAVAPNESSTMIPKDGEIVFSSTLDNFKVGKNSQEYKDLNYLITDTKNTAGATNSSNKLFIVGTENQTTNPQSYTNQTVYIQNNELYSNSRKVALNEDLTTLENLVYRLHYQTTVSVSPNIKFKSESKDAIATVSLKLDGQDETIDSVTIVPDEWTEQVAEKEYKYTWADTVTKTFTFTITKGAFEKSISVVLTSVNPIYYGTTTDQNKTTLTDLTLFSTATTTSVGRNYTVTTPPGNPTYFIIAVPEELVQPTQIGNGGASGFFAPITKINNTATNGYYYYRTASTQLTSTTISFYLK